MLPNVDSLQVWMVTIITELKIYLKQKESTISSVIIYYLLYFQIPSLDDVNNTVLSGWNSGKLASLSYVWTVVS